MYITPVGSPDRAERDILGMILDVFGPIQAVVVVGEQLCDVGIPALALITLVKEMQRKQSGWLTI